MQSRPHLDSNDGNDEQVCHDGAHGSFQCVHSERMDKIGYPVSVYARANLDWSVLHGSPILQKPFHLSQKDPLTGHSDVLNEVLPQIGPWVCESVQRSDVITAQFRWTYIGHGVIVGVTWAEHWGRMLVPSIIITDERRRCHRHP